MPLRTARMTRDAIRVRVTGSPALLLSGSLTKTGESGPERCQRTKSGPESLQSGSEGSCASQAASARIWRCSPGMPPLSPITAEVSQERHEARREQRRISHLEGEHGGGVRRAQLPHQPLCEGTQLLHGLLPALKRLHLRGRIGPEVEEHAAELLAESVRAASHEGCGGRHVEELPVEAACPAASVVHEDARHERGRAHDEAEVGGNGGRQNGKLRL